VSAVILTRVQSLMMQLMAQGTMRGAPAGAAPALQPCHHHRMCRGVAPTAVTAARDGRRCMKCGGA
jgi:hypothetical protein